MRKVIGTVGATLVVVAAIAAAAFGEARDRVAPSLRRTPGKTAPDVPARPHRAVTGVAGFVGGVGVAGRRGVGADVGHGCGCARSRRGCPGPIGRAT
jgi:hypothetical protein